MKVDPVSYPRLKVGEVFDFVFLGGAKKGQSRTERGRLLYAFNHRRQLLHGDWGGSDYRGPDFEIVAHRCGYEPVEPRQVTWGEQALQVYSVHLEAGLFVIQTVESVP